ncbi:hypothetical protein FRC09_011315 [Ceratobasidium sp. 395]|nr:hypothetical protein FRC09_011315 [Ceratobasidium sp. 395]
MDALRSIPDSVAAVRAGLRHVVRELLNGKVQISYIGPDADPTPTRMATTSSATSSSTATPGSGPVPNDKLPSPWGFITSGYALGLLLMAVILNRIAHVVVPPRQTGRRRQPRRIWHALFPINVSATHTRLISRVPSIALLGTALFLLLVALVQAAGIWEPLAPAGTWGGMWYVQMCRWAAGKEMSFVCWTTYIAVCVAMVMNTLTRGLEGGGSEGPHSFNLFGYSFLLHIYASPIMHTQTPKQPLPTEDMPPSRPDKHVLITIILPLLQLTILHILAVNKRWSRQRLIPTTVCGLLSIVHFGYVTLFSASSYPFFTYLNSLLESFLVGVILLTCTLHFTTRLLLQGQIVLNPFSEDGGIAHQSLLPSRADDYAVALLKLGSACIEATAMAGFGNEVSPIHTPDTLYITQSGVPTIPSASGPHGFAREIKNVHALEHELGSTSAWIDANWTREGWKFLQRISDLGRGVWGAVWRRCRGRRCGVDDQDGGGGAMVVASAAARTRIQAREVEDVHAVYARYLLGQAVLSDDEDDEFRFEEVEDVSGSESEMSENEQDSDVDESIDADVSAPELYADLARRSLQPRSRHTTRSPSPPTGTSSALTPMLIAHLTSPVRAAPLTRHRYTQLARPEPDSTWLTHLRDVQRPIKSGHGQGAIGSGDDDPRRNCVVCTVEPRAVICWPCRCLALCDDCRSNLASRMGAGKHQCPCCRRR